MFCGFVSGYDISESNLPQFFLCRSLIISIVRWCFVNSSKRAVSRLHWIQYTPLMSIHLRIGGLTSQHSGRSNVWNSRPHFVGELKLGPGAAWSGTERKKVPTLQCRQEQVITCSLFYPIVQRSLSRACYGAGTVVYVVEGQRKLREGVSLFAVRQDGKLYASLQQYRARSAR